MAAGATSFKKCAPCHVVGPTAKNKVDPLLNGLDGRESGSVAGCNYSDANKGSGTAGQLMPHGGMMMGPGRGMAAAPAVCSIHGCPSNPSIFPMS
jgi:hypothetical protein